MFNGVLAVFVSVTVCGGLMVPTLFHEKAFKLKMKFISCGGLRFGIGLPYGLGV